MIEITLETIGMKALIYCQTAERAKMLSSDTGKAMDFSEEQARQSDIAATVMEKELFELCSLYLEQAQERRNARDRKDPSQEVDGRSDSADLRP